METRRNWTIHSIALALVGAGWIAIVATHPDRDSFATIGSSLLIAITGTLGVFYAALTTLSVFFLRKHRWGAVMVHGAGAGSIVLAFGLLFLEAVLGL